MLKLLEGKKPILIFAISFFVMGAIACLYAAYELNRAIDSDSWPLTEGIVVQSEMKVAIRYSYTKYEPNILYEYSVNGIRYQNNCFRMSEFVSNETTIKKKIRSYKPGSKIKIYYNPLDPSQSVIEPGVFWYNLKIFIFGIAGILIGFVMWFVWKRMVVIQ